MGGAIPGQWDRRELIAECFMGRGRGLIPGIQTAWGEGAYTRNSECIMGQGHIRAVGRKGAYSGVFHGEGKGAYLNQGSRGDCFMGWGLYQAVGI